LLVFVVVVVVAASTLLLGNRETAKRPCRGGVKYPFDRPAS
jgi:hypothetical protein